jgi:hypothetical protein
METAREYRDFLDMLENSEMSATDVYQEIMLKEKDALESINKMIENKAMATRSPDAIANMSLSTHYFKMLKCFHDIYTDCMLCADPRELPWIFLDGDRKVYVGVLVMLVAVVLFLISITD